MSKTDFQNGFALGLASGGVVEVADTTEIDNLENLIDNSGVLDSTEGSVEDKVEQLIDKAEELDVFMHITNANQLFSKAQSFPTKTVIDPSDGSTIQQAVVNLPNATGTREAFAYWTTGTIPTVDEITVNASNITDPYGMFMQNWGVKKRVVLNLSDKCEKMTLTFSYTRDVKEIVLSFPTQNIVQYYQTFNLCSALEKIDGVLDFSSATYTDFMFNNCGSLKEVRFEPNTLSVSISLANSSQLTSKSVDSIVKGLKTLEEGATAQTLTLHKNIVLTDEQKANIQAKRWTLVQ